MTWVPALAAPIAVLGHILSETLVSGRSMPAVAREPSHAVLLLLSIAAFPLWFRAAASRRLGHAIFGFVALSLLVEGNGLSATALVAAIAITALWSWLSAAAIERVTRASRIEPSFRTGRQLRCALTSGQTPAGPYYAYVAAHGSRPPPDFLVNIRSFF